MDDGRLVLSFILSLLIIGTIIGSIYVTKSQWCLLGLVIIPMVFNESKPLSDTVSDIVYDEEDEDDDNE